MRISTYMMVGVALLAMAMLYPNWANAGPTTGVNPHQVVSLVSGASNGAVPASLVHWRGWRGFGWGWNYPSGSYYYRPYRYRSYGYYPYSYYNYYPYSGYYTYYPSGSWYIY